jgi:hypothetical protein
MDHSHVFYKSRTMFLPLANLDHFATTILMLLRRYVVDTAMNLESLKRRFMARGNFNELELTLQER